MATYKRHNVKVHPYGDILAVDECETCGAYVFNQIRHNGFHDSLKCLSDAVDDVLEGE